MTNIEALLAEVEPYTPSSLTLEKALVDVGLEMQDTYIDACKIINLQISIIFFHHQQSNPRIFIKVDYDKITILYTYKSFTL